MLLVINDNILSINKLIKWKLQSQVSTKFGILKQHIVRITLIPNY